MAKTRKIPLRKSVVSGEIIDKRDLLRIVKTKDFYDELIAYVDHKVKRRELGLE